MVDLDETLARGGSARLDLLRCCVMSMRMEPIFIFLAAEYRLRPAHAAAIALFDVFCASDAPARLPVYELLPPRELALSAGIATLRERWRAMEAPTQEESDESEARSVPAGPGRALFDTLVRGVRADARGTLKAFTAAYDPRLTPEENLPGGRLSAAQRQFVDRVWQPVVRPRLSAAGFWQVATI